jgi:hypothetical protein
MNRIPCQSKRIGQIPAYSKNSYGNPFAIGHEKYNYFQHSLGSLYFWKNIGRNHLVILVSDLAQSS